MGVFLIPFDYRITASFPICRWHPLDAPTPRKKENTNRIMTRSVRHRCMNVALVAWLCKRILELGDIVEVKEAVCDFWQKS